MENKINKIKLQGVMDITAGQSHQFVLTESGLVYAWGNSMNGRLGTE